MFQPTDRVALAAEINKLQWFHSIDFGDGLVSPGKRPALPPTRTRRTDISPCRLSAKAHWILWLGMVFTACRPSDVGPLA
jgi:hypothetical protein